MKTKQKREYLQFGTTEIDGGYTVKIDADTDSESPREWDNVGTMVCWHRRYALGDEQPSESPDVYYSDTLAPILKAGGIVLPLYLYEHSGISISASTGGNPFHCPWDSGQVGYIYATAETIRKEYGHRITPDRRAQAINCLLGEVATYDQFLRGAVYYYALEFEGETLDSSGGIYDDGAGFPYIWDEIAQAIAAHKAELANIAESERRARLNQVKAWIRNRVPLQNRSES